MNKIVLLLLFMLSGCSTTFQPYYGEKELKGNGGFIRDEKNGILFVTHGLPKGHSCATLGIIRDSRPTGPIPQASKDSDIANKAIEVGANVLLLADSQKEFVSEHNIMNAYTYSDEITGETTYIAYDCQPDE